MSRLNFKILILNIFLTLFIVSCGGGGGGGTTPPPDGGGGTITSSNAISYAANVGYLADVMDLGDEGVAIITGAVVENQSGRASLGQLINWQLDELLALQGQILPGNVVGVTVGPMTIPCPSSGDFSLTIDDVDPAGFSTGDTAAVMFNNCVIDTDTINGSMSIGGMTFTGDPSIPFSALSFTMTFTYTDLQFTWSTGSDTVSGTLNISQSTVNGLQFVSNYTGSISGSGVDAGENYTYSYTSMVLNGTFDASTGAYTADFAGTITDSTLGTFSVANQQSFTGIDPSDPNAGVAKVTASDSSSVTMTVLDGINVQLEVDSDGDGVTDATFNTTWTVLNNT